MQRHHGFGSGRAFDHGHADGFAQLCRQNRHPVLFGKAAQIGKNVDDPVSSHIHSPPQWLMIS